MATRPKVKAAVRERKTEKVQVPMTATQKRDLTAVATREGTPLTVYMLRAALKTAGLVE